MAQAYLDGLLMADTARLAEAFAPEAQLFGVPGRALQIIPVNEWIESRAGKVLEPVEDYRHRVVSVDVAGDAASAKVDLVWPNTHYVDYLSLLRIDGRWKIVNKIWHQEPSAAVLYSLDTRPLPADRITRYVGSYATDQSQFDVVDVGGDLRLRLGDKEFRLFYQGDDTFAPEFDPTARLRFDVTGDMARQVTIQQNGGSAVATRDDATAGSG